MSMLAERECGARRPDQGARVKVQVACRPGPGSRVCESLALSEVEDPRAGALGSRVRLALPAAEISQPSLLQKLAAGLLVKETARVTFRAGRARGGCE